MSTWTQSTPNGMVITNMAIDYNATIFTNIEILQVGNLTPYKHGWHITEWKVKSGDHSYKAKELLNMVQRKRIDDLLALCPEEERDYIRKDLEKYIL